MPSLSKVQGWDTTHLTDAAARWNKAADGWEHAFDTVAREIGIPWKGEAAEAAMRQAALDRVKVVTTCCDPLRRAARIASDGAGKLGSVKSAVLSAVARAQEDGFIVGEDLSVTDPNFSSTAADSAAREALGQAHANAIGTKALALTALDQKTATGITGDAGNIGQISFAEAPLDYPSAQDVIHTVSNRSLKTAPGGVQAVDFKQDGGHTEQSKSDFGQCSSDNFRQDIGKNMVQGVFVGGALGALRGGLVGILGGPLGILGGGVVGFVGGAAGGAMISGPARTAGTAAWDCL